MCRYVTEHRARSRDHEYLAVVTVYEEGVSKQEVKRLNQYSHKRFILIGRMGRYEVR